MKLGQLPLVDAVLESGADDRIFDGLLLAGPLVILLIAVLGRSVFTVGLVTVYLVVFVGHTLSNSVQ